MHVSDEISSSVAHAGSVERVRAWHPDVPGVEEVLHAHFVTHAYPAHTHDAWTLLIVDQGAITFDLDHDQHGAVTSQVTLLPPHVAHTGRAARDDGFYKRVVYLDDTVLGADLVGRAVDGPGLVDPLLRQRISQLHEALGRPGEDLEAESRLSLIRSRLHEHLRARAPRPRDHRSQAALAHRLRDLLDSRMRDGITLREAGVMLVAHPDHLVRAFTATFGLPPHRYLTGRRVDAARRLLLADHDIAAVAADVGFHDQAHFTRHFKAILGTTPGRYTR